MKKLNILTHFLVSLFLSASALAGWPTEDPAVAQLQAAFKKAMPPKKTDLALMSGTWSCVSLYAGKDPIQTKQFQIVLENEGELVRMARGAQMYFGASNSVGLV